MENLYLDYNATTPLAKSVIETIHDTLNNAWGNPSSGYSIGRNAKRVVEKARHQVAEMLHADPSTIVFTSGGTESSNMAIVSAIKHFKKIYAGCRPHVITSSVEHDATLMILNHMNEEEKEIDLSIIKPLEGIITWNSILEAINDKSCLISIMMANNETGVIFPVQQISEYLEEINNTRLSIGLPQIWLHTDAAQVIGKMPVSVGILKADYITIAGHKFYQTLRWCRPTVDSTVLNQVVLKSADRIHCSASYSRNPPVLFYGPRIGCLYVRRGAPLYPLLFGGGQEAGLRPGTENTPMIAGLGEAARLVTENILSFQIHLLKMRTLLEEELKKKFSEDELSINLSALDRLPNTLSVSFLRGSGREILGACRQVLASTGSACHSSNISVSRVIQDCLEEKYWRGAVRLSLGRETGPEEVVLAVEDLRQAFLSTT